MSLKFFVSKLILTNFSNKWI